LPAAAPAAASAVRCGIMSLQPATSNAVANATPDFEAVT
jgi:hypothetical protein